MKFYLYIIYRLTKFFSRLTSFEVLNEVIGLTIALFLINVWFIITIIAIYCFHYNLSNIGDTILKCMFFITIILALFSNKDDDFYDELKDLFKNEKYLKIKGYGVLAYVVFTIASLFYCLYYNT